MPTAGMSHDVVLTDGASTATGFMLWRDPAKQGAPSFTRQRAEMTTPTSRTRFGGLSTGYPIPANYDLVWDPDDFSSGFGAYRWSPWEPGEVQSRYAYADGVWTDTPTELSLSQAVQEADILIQNGGFERGATTGWTAQANTTIAVGTSQNSGNFSLNVQITSGNTGSVTHTVANYQLLASRTIQVRAVVKKTAGAGAETWNIRLDDGVTTTDGASVTLTASYQELSVQKAVGAGATKLDIIIRRTAPPANAVTVEIDDVIETDRFGDDGGGAIFKFVRHRSKLYAMNSQCVMVWDTTNLIFSPVRVLANSTGAFTDMCSFKGNLFICRGNNTAYEYTANPDTLLSNTWTVSALAGNGGRDKNADFMLRIRDVMWKVRNPLNGDNSSAAYAADPTASWTELVLGDTYSNFTGLYGNKDIPIAGKENGLWVYSRSTTAFTDIAPEYENYFSTFHWSRGLAYRGWLFMNADPQALWRYDGVNFQEVGFLLDAPQFDDMTTRVLAIGNTSQRLFVLVDTLTADNTVGEQTWLNSIQQVNFGTGIDWVVHTEHALLTGGATQAMYFDANTLYVGGLIRRAVQTKSMACAYRLSQPTLGTPSHGRTFSLGYSGTVVTPWWDGGYPDLNKAFRQLTIRLASTSATETVKVEMAVDEDTGWTTLQTLSTDGISTISIETQAPTKKSGKRCRFRFTLNAGTATTQPRTYPTTSPKIKLPFSLHTSLLPTRQNELLFHVLVGDSLQTYSGVDVNTGAQLLSTLNGYINHTFPITLTEDIDGDGTVTTYRVQLHSVQQVQQFDGPGGQRVFVYAIDAVEVNV